VINFDLKLKKSVISISFSFKISFLSQLFKQHKRILNNQTHILLNSNWNILKHAASLSFTLLRVGFLEILSKFLRIRKSEKSVKKNNSSQKESLHSTCKKKVKPFLSITQIFQILLKNRCGKTLEPQNLID
jgi:hypothetical protein